MWCDEMCDVWCGEISPIRPKNSAQQLLLCVLFFRLVMCDVVSHPAQELGPRTSSVCSLLSACNVWCGEMWCLWCGVVSHPAQELDPRTSSLCSLLSACNVWCGEMWYLMSGEMRSCVMCDVVRFRLSGPRTRPNNFFSVFDEVMNEWQHAWYKSNEVTMRNHKKLRNAWFAHLKQRCGGTVWAKLLVQYGPGRMSDLLAAVLDARADRVEEQAPIMPVARAAMQQRATMWIVFALGGPRLRDLLVRRSSTCCWSKKRCRAVLLCSPWSVVSRPFSFSDYTVMATFIAVRGVTTLFVLWLLFVGQVHKYVHSGPWHHHWKLFLFYYFTLFGVSCRDNFFPFELLPFEPLGCFRTPAKTITTTGWFVKARCFRKFLAPIGWDIWWPNLFFTKSTF